MNRRTFLAGSGEAGLGSIAGCVDRVVFGVSGAVRPDGEPETVPTELTCDAEGFERHPAGYEEGGVHWGDIDAFALRVDDLAFDYGDTAHITLTNTSLSEEETGNRLTYNLEVYTEVGWQDVRERYGHTDESVTHSPREGFEWEVELTEDGISEEMPEREDDELNVCPALESGRYRFVFFGVGGPGEAVAVAFNVHRGT